MDRRHNTFKSQAKKTITNFAAPMHVWYHWKAHSLYYNPAKFHQSAIMQSADNRRRSCYVLSAVRRGYIWHLGMKGLKGNSHQILLSEMSLPEIEVHIEKLLPKILGSLGRRTPLKDSANLPLYSASVL